VRGASVPCAVVAVLASVARPAAAPPPLAAVMDRAGAYVAEFHRRLSGIVAEERYVQDARTPRRPPLLLGAVEHRELRSDLLLVNVAGTSNWLEFRDVLEVDGEPVRDRSDRLTNLFLHPPPTADEQIRSILVESSRYNVGAIQRTVNTPIFPLLMSEVIAEDRDVRGTIAVSYQSEPLLGMLVPVEMRERYEGRRTKVRVDAAASYGSFRQFQVNVDEKFLLKK
jgi:hypothetical protein